MAIRVSKNRIVLESVPINEAKGANIASAGTCNIGAATGNYVHITGTTTITSFGTAAQAGISRTLIFDSILTLTHNPAAIILPTGANITTTAGDKAIFVADTTSIWNCIGYTRADGTALSGSSANGQATTFAVTQASHGLSVGNIIKSTGANTYGKAQANSLANSEVVGIVTTVTDASNFTFTAQGIITTGVPAQAAGTVMFLDPVTAGALVTTETGVVGQISKPVLVVLENAAKALFNNYRGMEIIDPPSYENTKVLVITVGDETTNITSGLAKVTFHMPYEFSLIKVKAGLTTASSSGNPAIDLNDDGTSVFSTTLTIDATETFSDTATTPAVLTSNPKIIASGSVMTIDIDTAGTGAKGLKLYLVGSYTIV
jgi:hypothetical protein